MERGRERGVAIFSVWGEQGEEEKVELVELVGLGFLDGLRICLGGKGGGLEKRKGEGGLVEGMGLGI